MAEGGGRLIYIEYVGKKRHLSNHTTKQKAAPAYDREARQCGEGTALDLDCMGHEGSGGGEEGGGGSSSLV
jgi:hypothetical protein